MPQPASHFLFQRPASFKLEFLCCLKEQICVKCIMGVELVASLTYDSLQIKF